MFIVVVYDIVDNRIRTRVAKILEDYGARVQKSVFECNIDDKKYLKMRERIEKEIDFVDDSVRYYFLCSRCSTNVQVSGWGSLGEDEDIIIV